MSVIKAGKISLSLLVAPLFLTLGACASTQGDRSMDSGMNQGASYAAIGEAEQGRVVRLAGDSKQKQGIWIRDLHTEKLYPAKNIGGDNWVLTEAGLAQYAEDHKAAE